MREGVIVKKRLTVILAAALIFALTSGCRSEPTPAPSGSSSGAQSPSASSGSESSSPSGSSPSTSAGSAKTGVAVVLSQAKSTDAGKASGTAETDATVVAVSVDSKGKILSCAIDALQAKVRFDDKGQLQIPSGTAFKTKKELGAAYGLKSVSGIGKEWYEQAQTFAKYVEGMTSEELMKIKLDETNVPIETDLKSSVTISVGDFMKGINKAIKNAKEGGAAEADKLSLGIVASLTNSASATSNKEGFAQVTATYVVLTRDQGGKISSCMIDASRSTIGFNNQGKLTTDVSEALQTNTEMKEAYGLKNASGIKKEWSEQAEAFAKYCTGKTAAEIAGVAIDAQGHALSSDIKSSVTIDIGGFLEAVRKAAGTV